jgi:hypothetical protein
MKRSFVVLLIALFTVPSAASAIRLHRHEKWDPAVSLTPSLGFVTFSDDFERFVRVDDVSEAIIGLELAFRVVEGLGLGLELADVPLSVNDYYQGDRGGDAVFFNFNIFYDFPVERNLSPFVAVGIGRMEILHPIEFDYGYSTFSFAGGLKARFHRNAGVQVRLRHTRTFLDAEMLHNTQVTGGVSFFF